MPSFQSDTWPPWCIAHRGFSARFPENTYAAFDAALQAPIDAVETDVQLSADDVPVIYHDRSLHMVGGGRRRVGERSLEALRTLDYGAWFGPAHAGAELPDLDALLARYGRRTVWLLEIKLRERDRGRLEQLMDLLIERLAAHDLTTQVMVLCFDCDLLHYGYRREPRLRCVWNQEAPAQAVPEADWLYAYSIHHRALTHELVRAVHALGKGVMTFTVDTPRDLKRVLAMGVNGVMANDPQRLAEALAADTRKDGRQ